MPAPERDSHDRLLPVVLNARCAQAGKPVLVDRPLPGEEFVDGQLVALARFLNAEKASAHGGDHLRLAANYPTLRVPGRKIRHRQWAPIGANDVAHSRPHLLFGHDTRYTLADQPYSIYQHD
jgi:hypothetical protein